MRARVTCQPQYFKILGQSCKNLVHFLPFPDSGVGSYFEKSSRFLSSRHTTASCFIKEKDKTLLVYVVSKKLLHEFSEVSDW